jgi:Spy/CpxP family protein refolding chaperone
MSWIRMATAAVAFCAVASVASAQGTGGPPPGAPDKGPGMGRGGMSQMLFNGIDLTDAQKAEIDKIREKYRAEMKALRPEGGPGSAGAPGAGGPPQMTPEARAKFDEIRNKQNAELRAVLTTAQQAIFDKNLAELKARREQRKPPGTK